MKNKKKNRGMAFLKKSGALLMTAVLLFSGMLYPQTVRAEADPTSAVMDPDAECSVTIVKYKNESTSPTGTDPTTVHKPMPGVGYQLYRIADIRQGTLSASTKIALIYDSLLKREDGTVIPIPAGLSTTEELSAWVNQLLESGDPAQKAVNLEELLVSEGITNEQGVLVFDQLPVGVYMIYENIAPSTVIRSDNQNSVFSLPMTAVNDGNDSASQPDDDIAGDNMAGNAANAGKFWDYDIVIRPKNNVRELTTEKHIRVSAGPASAYDLEQSDDPSNDILTDTEDYQIGETITYWISADVPDQIGQLRCYYLEDRMSQGQTFTNDTASGNEMAGMEVWGERPDGSMEMIPRIAPDGTENWRCSDPSDPADESNALPDSEGRTQRITTDRMCTFDLYFNTQSLSENADGSAKRTAKYRKVYVRYNAVLNEQAIIGGNGNENDAALKLSHSVSDFSDTLPDQPGIPGPDDAIDTINPQCIDTRVYTYDLQITKQGEDLDVMAGVEFELHDSEGTLIRMGRDENGYYTDANREEPSETLTIGEDGTLRLRGLKTGVYQLVETKTLPGYNLLREPVLITIASEASTPEFTYEAAENGEFFRIEEGKGYYILAENASGASQKLAVNLNGFSVGEYICLAENQPVYAYTLDGDEGDMSKEAALVSERYRERHSDSETMQWKSDFGMNAEGRISITVWNSKGLSIPSTGGIGTWPFVVTGFSMVLAGLIAAFLLLCGKRNEKM